MTFHNDKISDMVVILKLIKYKFGTTNNHCNIAKLRREAIKEFADSEFREGRYKNENSAVKTLHDACARRLKPDIIGILNFDCLVERWLHQNSVILKEILLRHSVSGAQRSETNRLF